MDHGHRRCARAALITALSLFGCAIPGVFAADATPAEVRPNSPDATAALAIDPSATTAAISSTAPLVTDPEPVLPATTAGKLGFSLVSPNPLAVFAQLDAVISWPGAPDALAAFATMPADQVADAFDADRDGVFIRLDARFRHGDTTLTVPAFAMRARPGGPWHWHVRFMPTLPGNWTVSLHLEGRARRADAATTLDQDIPGSFAVVDAGLPGPLIVPGADQSPDWLRERTADGGSRATWLFGACRAWDVSSDPKGSGFATCENIDREHDLLPNLRANGYNLLNQWQAPWEFLLVHRDHDEQWRDTTGAWHGEARPAGEAWRAWASIDQGRALAFDKLADMCAGGHGVPPVRMLLALLPHVCFAEESLSFSCDRWGGTSDTPDSQRNGFSAFPTADGKPMHAWDYFSADPHAEASTTAAKLFDAQANFYRYAWARWGASPAVGLWVLMDEIDAVGDMTGARNYHIGWFAHPECDRWLATMVQLHRGTLTRADGLQYPGDPYRHPLHAAVTSIATGLVPAGNLGWDGGPAGARPDVLGWHWYPSWQSGSTWTQAWSLAVDGVEAYAPPPGGGLRLISEYGAADRSSPDEPANAFYPTLYHHAIWASLFSGQCGTAMDWDDGKEFGEAKWRSQPGPFDQAHYGLDNTEQMHLLRVFLHGIEPEHLAPVYDDAAGPAAGAPASGAATVRSRAEEPLRVFALADTRGTAVHGWVLASGSPARARFACSGLTPGTWVLTWVDPWTALPVGTPGTVTIPANGVAVLAPGSAMMMTVAGQPRFPRDSRTDRGHDIAFHLVQAGPGLALP